MKKWFLLIFLPFVLLVSYYALIVISGKFDSQSLKVQVAEYRGNGTIKYLKSPGLLGVSGFAIRMSPIDLSKQVKVQYNLSGIPLGRSVAYLIVEDPCPLAKIEKGKCAFELRENGKLVKRLSSKLSDVKNTIAGSENRFHFFAYKDEKHTSSIVNSNPNSEWSLSVSWENPHLDKPLEAYILIRAGGNK